MVLVTLVAISVLVGTTVAILTMIGFPSDQVSDFITDDTQLAAVALAFVRWSILTFVCGAPLAWVVVALRTQFRRGQAKTRPAAKRLSSPVSHDE